MTANNATSFQLKPPFPPRSSSRAPVSRALLSLFTLFWIISPHESAQAQFFGRGGAQTDLVVRPMVGFTPENPLFRKEMWTPINLEVENFSQETIIGRLVVAPFSEIEPPNRVRIEAPIRFAPRQKKMIRLMGQLPDWTEDVNVFLEPGSRGEALATVGVREMDESERLAVVLSEGEVSYGGFEKGILDRAVPVHKITVHTLTRSDVLPEAVQGYDTVTFLVWDGLRLDDPTPAQQQALSDYLRLGGTLLLALGDRGERLDKAGYRDLLPAIPRETVTLSLPAPPAAEEDLDSSRAFSGAIHWESPGALDLTQPGEPTALLAAVGEFPGEPCLFLNGEPILYRQQVEAGWLLVSRISFADWLKLGDAGKRFWQDLIEAAPQHPPVFAPYLGDFNVYLTTSLLGELPSPWFIGGFLGLYTILVIPVNYMFFRKRKRLELAWLVLPVLAILFSWLAYHIGALQQQSGVVQRDIVVGFQPAGSTKARTQTMTAVYSPRRRVFGVRPAAESVLPLPLVTEDFSFQEKDFEVAFIPEGRAGSYRAFIEPLLVHHWAANNIVLDAVVDLGGTIDIRAEQIGKKRYRVEVANRTPYNITRLYLTKYANWQEVGGIPSGTSNVIEFREDRLSPYNPGQQDFRWNNRRRAEQFSKMDVPRFLEKNGSHILAGLPAQIVAGGKRILDDYAPMGTRRLAVYALAELDESISPIEVDADLFAHESASLLLIPVGIEGNEGRLIVGPTDWRVQLADLESDMRIFQNQIDLTRNMNSPEGVLSINPKVPLSYQNGPQPATLELSYHFGDRIGRNKPSSLTFEFPGRKDDDNTNRNQYGGYGAFSREVDLACSIYNHVDRRWVPLGKRFEIAGEGCHAFWDRDKQEVRVRGTLFAVSQKETQKRDLQIQNGNFRLPEISVTFETGEN